MKSIHYNNHVTSKSNPDFAKLILREILENVDGQFQISVDDGDGDIWKYTIYVECEKINHITQIKEN